MFLVSCTKKETSNINKMVKIDCFSFKIFDEINVGKNINNIMARIYYSEGDGSSYPNLKLNSKGIKGLIAEIKGGIFLKGEGFIDIKFSGKAESSGEAYFDLNFTNGNCNECQIKISVKPNPTFGLSDDIIDIDGNKYKSIYIGKQEWMASNLAVTRFNDGSPIQYVKDNSNWKSNKSPGYCYYNNYENIKFGKLYNWYAINGSMNGNKNICPNGWHVPNYDELTILSDFLGGDTISGSKLKEVGNLSWINNNLDATNSTLFSALPGGYRGATGNFYNNGLEGYFWLSTELNSNYSFSFSLKSTNPMINNAKSLKSYGYSVRCIKD